jgi:AICAR transformylase/IMP cyclohydrolase PurH
MEATKLLENYPKAAIVVKQWYLEKMLESLNNDSLPEDFKEHVRKEGVDDDKIAAVIDIGPRALFDVFDENHIYIQINVNTPHFSYAINEEDAVIGSWQLRKEAERAAIEQAFELLNIKHEG